MNAPQSAPPQIAITLQIEDAHEEGQIKNYMPAIRNQILMVLAGKTSEDLLSREGKEHLAEELRKAADEPVLDKPVTSELGGVSPTIVLPGKWSKADIRFQAQHVATQRLHNNGYNCVAAQVVVLPKRWAQRQEFIDALTRVIEAAPARPAYYPGSDDRVAAATDTYAEAQRLGRDGQARVDERGCRLQRRFGCDCRMVTFSRIGLSTPMPLPVGYYTLQITHSSGVDMKRGLEVADDVPAATRLAIDVSGKATGTSGR